MLSLTDMWRAAGGTDSQRPYEWLRTETAEMFIEHISAVTGTTRNELIQSLRGTDAGTWAHWQIGMAYAMKE
ncbi:MAG: KilA-N domain-containing protein [Gammaproteobacteria bacterium]|nr:KilA-N domain-containing protein [Gammaproteobacteria bacterium]